MIGLLDRACRMGLLLSVLLVAGCGRPEGPPPADEPQRAVPNLAGLKVMVLPAQPGANGVVPDGLDAAIGANLEAASPAVDWVLPDELARSLARAPWLKVRPQALPVSILRRPDLRYVIEPLYGELRRMGALVDARYAVLPYAAGYVAGAEGQQGRIEIAAAIIDTVGGSVLWRGIVAGERGPVDDIVVIGTAAQAMVDMIAPGA